MNFFGHGWLAAQARRPAPFVFGAMLPDLAAMAGLRVARVAHPEAEAGHRFHYATDAAFHRTERFQALCLAATRALREAGVRRGPARAVSHVGVELLLDGWLAAERGVPAQYGEALALAPGLAPAIALRAGDDPAPLLDVCGRVAAAPAATEDWCAPRPFASRLARILGRRPLLALDACELPAVRAWAAGAREQVARAAPALLAELRDGLG